MPILQKKKLRLPRGFKGRAWSCPPHPHYTCELLSLTSSSNPLTLLETEIMLRAARHQEQTLGEQELGWTPGGHFPAALFHKGHRSPERGAAGLRCCGSSQAWAQIECIYSTRFY